MEAFLVIFGKVSWFQIIYKSKSVVITFGTQLKLAPINIVWHQSNQVIMYKLVFCDFQVAQIQQQMQQMRLKQQMAPQQPAMHSGPGMFGSSPPPMANGWMASQQPMSFPQQQHPQYVTTGPASASMNYGSYPMGSMPRSGQTLSHQLWK